MHPAIQLLLLSGICVLAMIPLVAWTLVEGRRDAAAGTFFLGSGCFALAGVLFAMRGAWPDWVAHSTSQLLVGLTLLLWADALQRELGPGARSRRIGAVALAGVLIVYEFFSAYGLRTLVGHNLYLTTYAVQALWILILVRRISRSRPSRGLASLALGVLSVMVMNLVRVAYSILTGSELPLLSFTTLSNMAYVVNFTSAVLVSFGYLGFVLEKARERGRLEAELAVRAQERENAARTRVQELADLVRQRDEMLIVSSRFSALSSLAMLNSSLVHELSQPMQALRSLLESQAVRDAPDALPEENPGRMGSVAVGQGLDLVMRVTSILEFLRRLIASQRPDVAPTDVLGSVREILPVLQTEARQRRIELRDSHEREIEGINVIANRVMLQRVIFNLVTNAFEAIERQTARGLDSTAFPRWVEVTVVRERVNGADHVVVRISDSGPGLPQALLGRLFEPFQTGRPEGTGLGLALARAILDSWGGHVDARNVEGAGACLALALPVRGPSVQR